MLKNRIWNKAEVKEWVDIEIYLDLVCMSLSSTNQKVKAKWKLDVIIRNPNNKMRMVFGRQKRLWKGSLLVWRGMNLHAGKHWKTKPCPAFCREHVSQPHHNQYARKHPKVNPTWIARLEWNSGASPWQCPIVSRLTGKNNRPNWMDFMIGDLPV